MARAHQEAWAKHLGLPVVAMNSIGMQLAVIPPGKFEMGEGDGAVDVTLTKPFRLAIHEVTQGQWKSTPKPSRGRRTEPRRGARVWRTRTRCLSRTVRFPHRVGTGGCPAVGETVNRDLDQSDSPGGDRSPGGRNAPLEPEEWDRMADPR